MWQFSNVLKLTSTVCSGVRLCQHIGLIYCKHVLLHIFRYVSLADLHFNYIENIDHWSLSILTAVFPHSSNSPGSLNSVTYYNDWYLPAPNRQKLFRYFHFSSFIFGSSCQKSPIHTTAKRKNLKQCNRKEYSVKNSMVPSMYCIILHQKEFKGLRTKKWLLVTLIPVLHV